MSAIDVTKAVYVPLNSGKSLPATIMEHLDVGCFAVSWKATDGAWVVTTCDNDGQCKNGYVVQNVPEPQKPVPHTRETWPMYLLIRPIKYPDGDWIAVGGVGKRGLLIFGGLCDWAELVEYEGSHDGKTWEPLCQKEVAK